MRECKFKKVESIMLQMRGKPTKTAKYDQMVGLSRGNSEEN